MKILVCGTGYGVMYLPAIKLDPDLTLVGLMSTGSTNSRELAREYDVPLFLNVDELDRDIDVACVAIGGEAGDRLRLQLMDRGIHILAEHPLDPGPLEASLNRAAKQGLVFNLNTHFELLPAVDEFVEDLSDRSTKAPPLWASVVTAAPTVFSCLDTFRLAYGTLEPFEFDGAHRWSSKLESKLRPGTWGLTGLNVVIAGAPVTFLVHTGFFDRGGEEIQMSHRITVGFNDGNLTLSSLWGPVLWTRWITPEMSREGSLWTKIDEDAAPSKHHYLKVRISAIHHAIVRMKEQIDGASPPPGQDPEHILDVSKKWSRLVPYMRA